MPDCIGKQCWSSGLCLEAEGGSCGCLCRWNKLTNMGPSGSSLLTAVLITCWRHRGVVEKLLCVSDKPDSSCMREPPWNSSCMREPPLNLGSARVMVGLALRTRAVPRWKAWGALSFLLEQPKESHSLRVVGASRARTAGSRVESNFIGEIICCFTSVCLWRGAKGLHSCPCTWLCGNHHRAHNLQEEPLGR